MSMSANFHLDGMIVTVAGYDDPSLTGACVNINDGGYDHIAIHGTHEQLERMGRDIINGVAALRAGPLPDDDDDDEEDEDATQPEPEAKKWVDDSDSQAALAEVMRGDKQ